MRLRRGSLSLLFTGLLLVGGPMDVGLGAPQPAAAPRHWQVEFDFHDLQRLEVVLPGDRQPTTYWYVVYTVTNNTGRDVEFYPSFDLVTDTLALVRGGDEIAPAVYDVIRAQYKRLYPFFRAPLRVTGRLLQGPDNALTSAAVFREFDPQANKVALFVAGLSGEVVNMPNPAYDRAKPESVENQRFFNLRKTLTVEYDLPGDPDTRRLAVPVRRRESWVMR